MKALKYLLFALGGFVLLAALALAAAAFVVDGAFVKSRLERVMNEKNRTLRIEGEPKLRLFPTAGIALGKTTLSEPGSEKPFLALDAAEVAVRVVPLLSGEAVVETLRVAGLKVNVVRAKDGSMNFADLAGERGVAPHEEPPERGAPRMLRIGEIAIERAHLAYRDEGTGQDFTVADFNLKTGRLDGEAPGRVEFSARLSGAKPAVDLRAQAAGAVRFNLARQEIGVDKFSAHARGRIDRDTLAAEFSAPSIEITPARASGSAVNGSFRIAGPQRNVDVKLRIGAVEGTASALSIPSLALDFAAAAAGVPVKGHAEGAVKADLAKQTLSADIAAKLDESAINGKLGLAKFTPPVATFDIGIDRINLDRYLPPRKGPSNPREPIDLAALKGPTATGKIAIGALTARRVRLANVKAEVKLARGKLEVAPHSASLYGGTLAGSLAVEAVGNRVTLKETVQGVQVGPLLRDAMEQDRLEGRGNVNLDVSAAGASVAAMKNSLGGSARVELRDGAVKGINLAEAIQDVRSVLGSKSAKANDPSKRTDFSEIIATFAIRNGVAHNDDLQGKAPLLRLAGAGDADIGNSTVNYTARASVVATSRGQGGRDLSNLAGVTIPVKLTGALEKPDVSIDFGELVAKSGVSVGRAIGSVSGAAGGAASGVRDKLKGLFGR